ncbi:MAG TPA: DUF6159 family protein [Bryobacteraceae bacterium]|nr:DUF6159 family protein [Bryobacteraceae bacterium]
MACSRTWHLYKESFAVLSQDGEVLAFPVLSGICAMVLAAGFFVPLYRDGTLLTICRGQGTWDLYAGVFAWYYLNNFIFVFFNTALVGCAIIRLSGGDPTIGAGLRMALARTPRIALWVFISTAFGLLMSFFHNRRGWLMRAVGAAATLSWTMMTYLIVPVLIVEDRSVFSALGRSKQLFQRQWGADLIGSFGFGILNSLLMIPGAILAIAIWRFDEAGAVIVFVTYSLFLTIVSSAVSGVFKAALYRYAATGNVPPGFTSDAINPSQAIWLPEIRSLA